MTILPWSEWPAVLKLMAVAEGLVALAIVWLYASGIKGKR